MKRLRQIITQIQSQGIEETEDFPGLLWEYICYSPKMPVRLQQQQLLDAAEKTVLKATDTYFAKTELNFNTFRWGNGRYKILITHGWGSKAADFNEVITALTQNPDFEVISFDAPGNGSSESELSNLLLFVEAVMAMVKHYGKPDVMIGHSLGAMANIVALNKLAIMPSLLISLTPLVRLKENFEASMSNVGISAKAQAAFLKEFIAKFDVPASDYMLSNWYKNNYYYHWIAYDADDKISPYQYLNDFLKEYPDVRTSNYPGVGHDRIIKSEPIIHDLIAQINTALHT